MREEAFWAATTSEPSRLANDGTVRRPVSLMMIWNTPASAMPCNWATSAF
jgi:hypothetical protein